MTISSTLKPMHIKVIVPEKVLKIKESQRYRERERERDRQTDTQRERDSVTRNILTAFLSLSFFRIWLSLQL